MPFEQLEEIQNIRLDFEIAFEASIHSELAKSKVDSLIEKKLIKIDKLLLETIKSNQSTARHNIKNEYVIQPSQQSSQKAAKERTKTKSKSPKNEKRVAPPKQTSKSPKKSKSKAALNEKTSGEKAEKEEQEAAAAARQKPG